MEAGRAIDREMLLRAVPILAAGRMKDEAVQAAELMAIGIDEAVAWRLVALVPSAFALPILEDFGVSLAPSATTRLADDQWLDFHLEDQPEFVAAVALAREHRQFGLMDHDDFVAIAGGTA